MIVFIFQFLLKLKKPPVSLIKGVPRYLEIYVTATEVTPSIMLEISLILENHLIT